jgi:hypothetical protein
MSPEAARALRDEDDAAIRPDRPRRPELTLLTQPLEERRTVVITGQRPAPRRRRPQAQQVGGHPDRIAMWAFLFGIFLVVVAMATG